jgi:hypothetical protein
LESDDVPGYFESYGWQYERQGAGLYRTGFLGDTGHYDIWVRVGQHWVYFTINPYVERPEERGHGGFTLRLLLEANHELNMAKFAVDDDGDVLLTVELPKDNLAYSHFADALTALSHYADAYKERFEEAITQDEGERV